MLKVLFILLLSTNVFAEDDLFKPFVYVVGELMIKSVIGSDANFPIQWTESSAKNVSVIATGSNVLSPLIDKFESLLKVAAQNSESGSAGTGTVVTTGSLSNALSAISLAQSGVALENILYLSLGIFLNNTMGLLNSKQDGNYFFNVLQKRIVPYSNLFDDRLIHITPTALSQDLERRSNQMKATSGYGCRPYLDYILTYYGVTTSPQISIYCIPHKALFDAVFEGSGSASTNSEELYNKRPDDSISEATSSEVINFFSSFLSKKAHTNIYYANLDDQANEHILSINAYNYSQHCYFVRNGVLVAENCYPDRAYLYGCTSSDVSSCVGGYRLRLTRHFSLESCPIGLEHTNSLFLPDNVLICTIPLSRITDIVYKNSYEALNLLPVFELYPDFTFKPNPYVSKGTTSRFFVSQDGSYLFYPLTDPQNSLISGVIALKVFSDGFLLSRTVGGLKINRQGSITTEIDLQIREIEKYDFDFNLVERNLSFWTGDGFDIGIQNSFLSPKTYGIAGKTIAAQFAIRTLSSDMVLPEEKKEADGGVVPCGLGKDVQVLKTRKNAEGKDENYFETQRSPPCVTNWGKAPTGKNVKDFKQLCPKEGEEGYDPKCKESDFFKDSLKKLMDNFSLDSDSFKIKDVTSTKCVPLKLDFAGAGNWLGGGGVHDIKIICEVFEKSPTLETLFRTFFMITWFVTALFKLLSA